MPSESERRGTSRSFSKTVYIISIFPLCATKATEPGSNAGIFSSSERAQAELAEALAIADATISFGFG
jgi:hypothetical protein